MPYPEPHVKVSFIGDLVGTPETWSFGLRFRASATPGVTSAENLFTLTAAMLTDNTVLMQQGHRLTSVKIALIEPDGRYPEGVEAVEYIAPTPVNGTAQGGHPPQCSVAVTTLTAVRRGRASKGRFYLPTTARDVNVSGTLNTSDALNMATTVAAWVDAITDEMAAPAAVFSNIGVGVVRNIVAVGVGEVVDTQRRRRRQLVENRQEAPVNP